MPSYINFQDDSTYPGAKFRRMVGRQQDLAQGFDDPNSFKVSVSNDNPGKLESTPGIAWIQDGLGGVYFVEREHDVLYTDTKGTSGTIVLRVLDVKLLDGKNELMLEAIPTGTTIPARSLKLATYTGSGADAVLTDVRLTTPGQNIVSRSGPANYGAPNTTVMGLGPFSPGTQYTDLNTGIRYVKATDGTWLRDKGDLGSEVYTGTAAPTSALGKDKDTYFQTSSFSLVGATSTTTNVWKKSGTTWNKATGDIRGSTWFVNNGSTNSDGVPLGDMLLRSDTGDVYQKTATGWTSKGNIKGPKGDKGDTGATGPQGPAGKDGTGAGTVNSINSILPNQSGNVTLTAANVGALPVIGTTEGVYFTVKGDGTNGPATFYGNASSDKRFAVRSSGGWYSNALDNVAYNVGVGDTSTSFGGGQFVLGMKNASTKPTGNPTSGAILFIEGGVLKVLQSNGTTVTVQNPPVTTVNSKTGAVTLAAADVGAIPTSQINVANGVAGLNSYGNVNSANLPDLGATYVKVSTKNTANGVAGLDASGKVGTDQLPTVVQTVGPWVDIPNLTGVTGTARARVYGDTIQLIGRLNKPTPGFTSGDVIATLPASVAPKYAQDAVFTASTAADETLGLVRVDIKGGGDIVLMSQANTATGTGGPFGWVGLCGFIYKDVGTS